MTPISNEILSEMLDNSLYDIKLLRQEVAALREAKASASAEAYELREELDSRDEELRQALRASTEAHTEAKGIIKALREERLILQEDFREANGDKYRALNEVKRLKDEVEHDDKLLDEQAVRIAELESEVEQLVRNSELDLAALKNQSECISDLNTDLRKATLRAHENANLWGEARQEADDLKGRLATAHAKLYDTEREVEDLKADADALDWYQGETKRLRDEVERLEQERDEARDQARFFRAESKAIAAGALRKGDRLNRSEQEVERLQDEVERLTEALSLSKAAEQAWADKYGRLTEQAQTSEGRLADCRESLRQSERDLADAEDQLALYADNCECSQ